MTTGPIKATGADTGGVYALVEFQAPAGDQPPPHVHHHTGEAFYVLDGTLSIRRGDDEIVATAGSFVYVQPGQIHTYTVKSAEPARFLVIVDPPELIGFFQEMVGDPAAVVPPGGHDIEQVEPPASSRC
jgi:quercetin dioxygenase-like cupin family protein